MTETTTSILTGIKPTGHPHLGNYVGMIKPTLELFSNNKKGENFLFIANYHALNTTIKPEHLVDYTYDIAATLLAFGLDPETTHFYRQSDVPEIFELATILMSVTPKGLMNRAHAYKASIDDNRKRNQTDIDAGINMGLYTYPILMAADILLFNTNTVPVGQDQIQHVEFARDIAGFFNRKYRSDFFTLPVASIQKQAAAIPGLDGRKMSKSYNNTIPIFGDKKARRKLVNKIITDSKLPEEPKNPDESTLFMLFQALASNAETDALRVRFCEGGLGYGEAKKLLADKLDDLFAEPAERYQAFMHNKDALNRLIIKASQRARNIASARIKHLRSIIGV